MDRKVVGSMSEWSGVVTDWENFYNDVFGIQCNFSNLRLPEKQEGFDRLIIVAKGMTPQRLYDKCKELFPCWKWTDENLDKIVKSERSVETGAYAVWFRDRVEADEDLKNFSADQLKEQGVPGITLEERLIYELRYFKETGEHLDVRNITLCAGSRGSGGSVLNVSWCSDGLRVDWCQPGYCDGHLRSRRAVL